MTTPHFTAAAWSQNATSGPTSVTPETRALCLQALRLYLRQLADEFKLHSWVFDLREDPCAPEFNARIAPIRGREVAVVEVSDVFFLLAPESQRQCLVHELLHCVFAPVQFAMESVLSKKMFAMVVTTFEYAIDKVADSTSVKYPLPLEAMRAH